MTQANQMAPTPTVNRSRLRSATDDPPSELDDTAAEHVGQSAAPTLVQQHESDQHSW